jgi:hypothetical protein
MYHTNREGSFDYDCLYYTYVESGDGPYVEQVMEYCRRPSVPSTNPPSSDHLYLTFAELKKHGISSAQLVEWSAPVDVAENYEIYMTNGNESNAFSSHQYFNCSHCESGAQCEYTILQAATTGFDLA